MAWIIAHTLEEQNKIKRKQRLPFFKVTRIVLLPGIALLLSTVSYSVTLSFTGLFFQENHWMGTEIVIACFGITFVLARILFSDMPDRFGGASIAILSLLLNVLVRS